LSWNPGVRIHDVSAFLGIHAVKRDAGDLASIVEHGHASVRFGGSDIWDSIDTKSIVVVDGITPASTMRVLGRPVERAAITRSLNLSLVQAQVADSVIRDVTGGQVALVGPSSPAPLSIPK
jgi:hypothetical protein